MNTQNTKSVWVPDPSLIQRYEDSLLPLTREIQRIVELNPQSVTIILDLFWSLLKNSTINIVRKLNGWVELCQLYGSSVSLEEVMESAPLDDKGQIHCKASRAIVSIALENVIVPSGE